MTYSETVNGVEVVGVVFDPKNGIFYEFVDPETHDKYQKLECPRTGKTVEHKNSVEKMMSEIVGMFRYATVPADVWPEFREVYVSADEHDFDKWSDIWRDMAEADPRF